MFSSDWWLFWVEYKMRFLIDPLVCASVWLLWMFGVGHGDVCVVSEDYSKMDRMLRRNFHFIEKDDWHKTRNSSWTLCHTLLTPCNHGMFVVRAKVLTLMWHSQWSRVMRMWVEIRGCIHLTKALFTFSGCCWLYSSLSSHLFFWNLL